MALLAATLEVYGTLYSKGSFLIVRRRLYPWSWILECSKALRLSLGLLALTTPQNIPMILASEATCGSNNSPSTMRYYWSTGARLEDGSVEVYPNQSSGVLASACWGDVFVRQPSGQSIEVGDLVDVLPYCE